VFLNRQEHYRRKINEAKSHVRAEWIPVLAILITSVLLLVGCTSITTSHSPVISDFTAESEALLPFQTCEITCVASDLDGDSLSYEWAANRGSISGEGPVVSWTAPEADGTYTITVSVSDSNGGQDIDYLSIEVVPNSPPTVESLDIIEVVPNNPPTIESLDTEEAEVIVSASCNIECVASDQDGDELGYEWSASGGSISGEGSMVTWTAPEAAGTYTIMVMVTDDQGGEDTASLDIDVLAFNNPPKIKDKGFLVTNKIDEPMENGKVLKEHSYYIECIASDPDGDELSYDWWVSDGEILEEDDAIDLLPDSMLADYRPKIREGSVIFWRAPDYTTKVTFEVTVSDDRGGEDDHGMLLKVVLTACDLWS